MRRASTILALLLLHGCAAFGVRSEVDRAEATLLATHTLHDYEIARAASSAALARLEGSFELDPNNEDLMILLADAWVAHAELFLVDAYERAEVAGPGGDADYERERVKTGFERAGHWGLSWLHARVPELDTRSLSEASLDTALKENFDDAEDATALLVLGHAFLGTAEYQKRAVELRYDLNDEGPAESSLPGKYREPLAKLGAVFLMHSIELDEGTRMGSAHALLGTYYADIKKDAARATQHFQRAALIGQGKYLLTEVQAAVAHCRQHDPEAFESELDGVLKAGDPVPEVRLDNAVAKRRASRWLVESALRRACSEKRQPTRDD